MKKIFLSLTALLMASCASINPKAEDLKQSNKCLVWKDNMIGKSVVEVEGELARQKQTCWVMNTFACTYTDYTFKEGSSEILSSLPPKDKPIAKLDGRKLSVNMAGITVDPFELKDGQAEYEIQGPIGPKQKMKVEYNDACTPRQAALGLLTVIAR